MNVEMCPKSAMSAKLLIDSRGQELIGWYHSHPFFEANPSQIDIKNHANYQKMFQASNKPFIAAISAPYHSTSFKTSNWRSLNQIILFQIESSNKPYELKFKQLSESEIKRRVLEDLTNHSQKCLQNSN